MEDLVGSENLAGRAAAHAYVGTYLFNASLKNEN